MEKKNENENEKQTKSTDQKETPLFCINGGRISEKDLSLGEIIAEVFKSFKRKKDKNKKN